MPLPDKFTCNQLKLFFSKENSLIPLTVGPMNRNSTESVLVVFFSVDSTENGREMQESQASQLVNQIQSKYSDVLLIQTKRYELSELSSENIFKTKNYNNLLKNGPIIGLEFNGYDCTQICLNLVNSLNLKPSKLKIKF